MQTRSGQLRRRQPCIWGDEQVVCAWRTRVADMRVDQTIEGLLDEFDRENSAMQQQQSRAIAATTF